MPPDSKTAYIVLSDDEQAHELERVLLDQGIRVAKACSVGEAERNFAFIQPDVALVGLLEGENESAALERLRHLASERKASLIALRPDAPELRSRAFHLGLVHQLVLPCEDEELSMVVRTLLGIDVHQQSRPLSGDLSMLPLTELLTLLANERRDVTVHMEHENSSGLAHLQLGDIVDAAIEGGPTGDQAVEVMLGWHSGSFTAHFGQNLDHPSVDPSPTPTNSMPPSPASSNSPPSSSSPSSSKDLPRPPPADPPPLEAPAAISEGPSPSAAGGSSASVRMVLHEVLALMNILASIAVSVMHSVTLEQKLERVRQDLEQRYPFLGTFCVHQGGQIALRNGWQAKLDSVDPEQLTLSTAHWMREFVDGMKGAPVGLPPGILNMVAESAPPELHDLGLGEALGIEPNPLKGQ